VQPFRSTAGIDKGETMSHAHIYGPVPSRRIGRFLGADPIPFKTCTCTCVYCQLGRTTPLTDDDTNRDLGSRY
jgi:wyosine [tRNA(Phe)-imidazoG37] synthetase (radical SAM superfamily)